MNHPYLDKNFLISWSKLTPEFIKPDILLAIEHAKENIETICNQDLMALTYESTFGALEKASEELMRAWGLVMHLDSVNDEPAQREAIAEVMPEVVVFSSSVSLDPALWKVLKAAAECEWVKTLSPVKQRFVQETLKDFRESGADLPDDLKPEYAEIESQLSLKTKKFAENVLDSTNSWELIIDDEAELSGLPDSAKEGARLEALAMGYGTEDSPKWRFTQKFTSTQPVMQFADSDELRRKVWSGSGTIGKDGEYDNESLINEILDLRERKAALLGYKCFADYATSRRMAGNGTNALNFINDLHDKVLPAFLADMEAVRMYKEEKTGQQVKLLAPWETSYWAEKRRRELYDFDDEDLRPYYSVQNVMNGLFSIYSTLYGIRVTEKPTMAIKTGETGELPDGVVEVWHPDVLFYEIHDTETGEHLGSFYADWHPRDSKRAGAWMNYLSCGLPPQDGASRIPHLGLMVGNMTKPVGDKPALLSHMEVETIFHEFGHLLHQLLSDVEVKSLAGTNVAWDFVELPSQINENWCWERESVDLFARHYETGEKIPAELFDRMLAARNYMSATAFMRQLCFGKLDLELHVNRHLYQGMGIEEADEKILSDYRIPLTEKAPSVARRLTHIFADPTGYAAGYYSYKWAEVLEADAFSRFKAEGVLNPVTGRDFRRCILSKGNSKPAAELYRDFMGREPNADALLMKSGIL